MSIIIPEKYETWKRAIAYSIILLTLWILVGEFIASEYLDRILPLWVKVLDKDDVLQYLAAALAVQIPVFILFLQEMVNAGFVKRKVLPRVTRFKEIIFVLLTGALLVVASPRNSYLYFPVAVMAAINFLAVYRAVTVTFHQEQYEKAIKNQLKATATNSFIEMDQRRRKSNERYDEINGTEFIEISYLGSDSPNTEIVLIKAKSSGVIEDIDVSGIVRLMAGEFEIKNSRAQTEASTHQKTVPKLKLGLILFRKVEAGDTIAELELPNDYNKAGKIEKRIERYFKINTKRTDPLVIKYFDEILLEFERAIDYSIRNDDVGLLNETLDLLRVMVKASDKSIASEEINKKDDNYKLSDAFNEISSLVNDGFSIHLRRIYEIVSDNMAKCVVQSKKDLSDEFMRFVYRDLLNLIENPNLTSIARSESVLSFSIGQFVYKNTWNRTPTPDQIDIRKSLFFRLKEHTSLIRYELKDDDDKDNDEIIQQWFEVRIARVRDLILVAIKDREKEIFNDLFNIFVSLEEDLVYERMSKENSDLVRCSIFMIGAYLRHHELLDSEFGRSVTSVINNWSDQELLSILLQCTNRKLERSWDITRVDSIADGVMRTVPNYEQIMKKLWIDLMLDRPFNHLLVHYDNKKELEETLIFTNGMSSDENNDLLKYLEDIHSTQKEKMESLIKEFIKVRRDWEKNKLSKLSLDPDKTSKFKNIVNNSYLESSIAVRIFGTTKNITIDKSGATKNFKEFGINKIFDKEAFIPDSEWHSGYITDQMAEQLGRQIAIGQDRYIFNEMLKNYTNHPDANSFLSSVKNYKSKLVVSNQVHFFELDRFSKLLSKNSDYKEQYLKGVRQKLPIQKIYSDELERGIYIIDMDSVGFLTQKQPENHPVKVTIDAFSHNEKALTRIMRASPDWLGNYGNRSSQIAYLKTKVKLYVAYVFKYEKVRKKIEVNFLPIKKEF